MTSKFVNLEVKKKMLRALRVNKEFFEGKKIKTRINLNTSEHMEAINIKYCILYRVVEGLVAKQNKKHKYLPTGFGPRPFSRCIF